MTDQAMLEKIKSGHGFIAALDQSGGSTPKALQLYGIEKTSYSSDEEMFALIHAMRARIATAPAFTGDKVLGAILFEMTMDREISGKPSAQYLWEDRGVVPFLKIDKGLEAEIHGVQIMKPIPGLSETLNRARDLGIFGTKMRSVVKSANESGIISCVAQQFVIAEDILKHGLVPIIEPEVDINAEGKAKIEAMLHDAILGQVDTLPNGQQVILKLTLPEEPNFYTALIDHPKVLRVVALSGGYDQAEANSRLAQNRGIIASFSRALTEGLSADQTDEVFHSTIARSIAEIAAASTP
ncbi:MAG: fructose bisphosphate aldolase [Pseudomonadota bacterium]